MKAKATSQTIPPTTRPRLPSTDQPASVLEQQKGKSKHDPETDLQRAIRAERELDAYKYRRHNEIYHRDNIIESLKNRVVELESAFEAANARIRELEGAATFAGEETP
jgi:hypothetical protein